MIQRLITPFLCLVAVLALAACGANTVPLAGTITDSYTGQPLAAATLTIGSNSVPLKADGSYSTTAWQPDDTVAVAMPGYDPVTLALREIVPERPATGTSVALDIELRPNTLAGTVSSKATKQPLVNALVAVQIVSGTETVTLAQATTDANGAYQLSDLPEQFTLLVQATDHALLEEPLTRTTSYDAALSPNVLSGTITDQLSGEPIVGVKIVAGTAQTTTGSDGSYRLADIPADATEVTIEADGYAPITEPLDLVASQTLAAVLRPNTLQGVLVDRDTGEPIPHATIIATEGLTTTAVSSVRIDRSTDGTFKLNNVPESGYIQVLAPGYRKAVYEIKPGSIPSQIGLEPFKARAIYVKTSTAAYMPEVLEEFWQKIDETELNALVIDLKSDNMVDLGLIYYQSNVPIIRELGTSRDLMDIRGILAEAKRRNVYTIARIHVFSHDNLLAETRPDWAAQDKAGCVPNENRKCNGPVFYADWDIAWLDPWNRDVWEYNIQLGVEAAQLGFDEVQFDYIRFPSDAVNIKNMVLSQPTSWRENPDAMYNNIVEFMTLAHKAMNDHGAFFSVDVFGYATWEPQASIGQRADKMAEHADYICPMIYPSHFSTNELGLDNASAHPYRIIEESLIRGQALMGDARAKQRPWLQAFTLLWVPEHLKVRYGDFEVREQIDATENSPYGYGWSLWDPDNHFEWGALKPAAQTGAAGQ